MAQENEKKSGPKTSIATQLLKIVFGCYILITLVMTSLQLAAEYTHVKNTVQEEIRKFPLSFGHSIADSLWTYNYDLLQSIIAGMNESPIVSGVKIEDENNVLVMAIGVIQIDERGERQMLFFDANGRGAPSPAGGAHGDTVFNHCFPITATNVNKETKIIGYCTVYSGAAVVFQRVRFGFFLIIINSVIKTMALWTIFLFFARRLVGRPLGRLAEQIERVNFDNMRQAVINVNTKGQNELKILEESFNVMLCKIKQDADRITTANTCLEKAEHNFRKLFENAVEGIFQINHQGRLLTANPSMARIFGYPSSEKMVSGDRPVAQTLFADKQQFLQLIDKLEKEKQLSDHEVRLLRRDGMHFWGAVSMRAVSDPESGQRLYDGMVLDITDRKKRQIAEWAQQVAENSAREKGEFLAKISHELRTPLIAIAGFSELLSSHVTGEKEKSYLKGIMAAGKGLTSLTSDIIDLSRIDAGKIVLEPSPTAVRAVCQELEHFFRLALQEKDLSWICDVEKQFPDLVLLDESRVRQVLLNLVGNAIKFTDSGYVKLSVLSAPAGEDKHINMTIVVADTGIGIAANMHQMIFDTFIQRSGKKNLAQAGFGLGLAISKRLVELMKGTIRVESSPGKGSRFILTLTDVPVVARSADGVNVTAESQRSFSGDRVDRQTFLEPGTARQSQLRRSLLDDLNNMRSAIFMPDIRQFIVRLETLATRCGASFYRDYAMRLKALEQSFDIEGIERLISELRDVMTNFPQKEE